MYNFPQKLYMTEKTRIVFQVFYTLHLARSTQWQERQIATNSAKSVALHINMAHLTSAASYFNVEWPT